MNLRWEESEFVLCDLRLAAQFIHRDNPDAARRFLEAAYDTFDFLALNPGLGRQRTDLGFQKCVRGGFPAFGGIWFSTASCRTKSKSGVSYTALATCMKL